tara:strand:+ start:137 stop:1129 length:993 start_codon:yes stop_codon:yes gene_type:complete
MSTYNELIGLKVKYLSADPPSPENGQVWYNASTLRVAGILGAGTWASGGTASTVTYQLAGAGIQTAALKMGGANSTGTGSLTSTEEYNGTSWTTQNGIPAATSYMGGCGVQTAAIIAGGGTIPNYDQTTTREYDGTNWSTGGALNASTGSTGQIIGIESAALISGGDRPGASPRYITNVEEYDGSSWTAQTALPASRSQQGTAGIQTAGLVFGGTGSVTDTTLEYDGSSWTSGGNLPANNKGIGGSGTQTVAIGFGGNPGSSPGQLDTTVNYNGTSWSANPATMGTAVQLMGNSSSCPSSAAIKFGGASPVTAATEEYTEPVGTGSITTS